MDQVIKDARAAIERGDWPALKPLLHPYLHWTDGDQTIRGRNNVLAHLTAHPPVGPPASHELRDGQIYRWTQAGATSRAASTRNTTTRVVLEVGKTWTFASALEWPGWCRRGKGEDGALQTLLEYADRYVLAAGAGFAPGEPMVVDRLTGGGTTDFGVPDKVSRLEHDPLEPPEAERLASVLASCWRRFDEVVAGAPATLRKGPRGGGRDRDPIVEHVREAERHYARQVAVRMPPDTSWPDQRTALVTALTAAPTDTKWPARYAFRRIAWHVLDHAWEIEDKST